VEDAGPTPRLMGSVPEKPPETVRQTEYLTSSTAALVEELKRWLVCELYLRRGKFWKLVRACRMDWDLNPIVGLPPATTDLVLWPENKPEHSYAAVSRSHIVNTHLSKEQRRRIEEHNRSVAEFESTWYQDLGRIVKSTVPTELGAPSIGDWSLVGLPAGSWEAFTVSGCGLRPHVCSTILPKPP
jgi:hypothetical protein